MTKSEEALKDAVETLIRTVTAVESALCQERKYSQACALRGARVLVHSHFVANGYATSEPVLPQAGV